MSYSSSPTSELYYMLLDHDSWESFTNGDDEIQTVLRLLRRGFVVDSCLVYDNGYDPNAMDRVWKLETGHTLTESMWRDV